MMKRILVLAMVLAVCLTAVVWTAGADAVEMYVKTGDGRTLNVRSGPGLEYDMIGSLNYGDRVLVDTGFVGNTGWTAVVWGSYGTAFVMSRFLVSEKPAPYSPTPGVPTDTDTDIRAYSTVNKMNTIVDNARFVEPYMITVTPTRASGWVYLRWFPSRNAKEMATYGDGKQLRVIAELKDWFQVEDPDTGKTGFLYKSYVR